MINSYELQTAYVNLYRCLRDYIWDYDVVVEWAEVETKIFSAFPDISNLQNIVKKFYRSISESLQRTNIKDAKIENAFQKIFKLLSDSDDIYLKITLPREVLSYEDNKS